MEAPQNKEPSLYRDVLKRAWRLVRKHPFLLLFGFFAAFTANGEQYDVLSKNVETVIRLQAVLPILSDGGGLAATTIGQFWDFLKGIIVEGAFLNTDRLDATLLFYAILIGPIVLAQIAIIMSTKRFVQDEGTPTFSWALGAGAKHFLPVLLLNVLLKIVIYGLFALVAYPLFVRFLNVGATKQTIDALAVVAFLILVPLHIIFSFLTKFAIVYVVTQGKGFWAALRGAWRLFSRHWLVALEMSFLLIVINILISAVFVGTVSYVFDPTGQFTATVFFLTIMLVGSFLAVFQYAAWTALLLRLEHKQGVSKLERWATVLSSYLGAKPTVR